MKSQADIRRNVTDQIIESLKSGGLPPWRKSWSDDPNAPGLHTSLSTGQPYRGINQLILQCSARRTNHLTGDNDVNIEDLFTDKPLTALEETKPSDYNGLTAAAMGRSKETFQSPCLPQ